MMNIDREYIVSVISDLQKDPNFVPNGVLMEAVKRRVCDDLVNELRQMYWDGVVTCHKTLNSVMFNLK
jgi:hypothetical protein